MINIKVCDVAPRGACSYYRGLGPLHKLRHINPDINVEYIEAVSWTALNNADILFLMRPVENTYIEAIELAHSFGVKVWIDFDDALHEIPADNPAYKYHTQKHILKNMEYAIENSDVVTFSTQAIKDYYSKIRPNSIVIPNAFNNYNYQLSYKPNIDSNIISWRGSNTHRQDLLSQKEGMVSVAKRFTDWKWVFLGGDPWYITEEIPGSNTIEDLEIVKYNRLMINLKPEIHIVPLIDSVFNRSKSSISWMEGTAVGAACLCPSIPEFMMPGAVNYTDNFEYLLEKLIKSKSFRKECFDKSREYIQDNLLLSKVNMQRISIIEEVMKL